MPEQALFFSWNDTVNRNNTSPPSCPLCENTPPAPLEDGAVCPACQPILRLVEEQPELVRRAWLRARGETIMHVSPGPTEAEMELPDVLDGKRYRTIDRDANKWYLSVSEVEGRPVEIFASTAFDRSRDLQSRISTLTTITRLISLILRHIFLGEPITFDKCLRQIQRSSRQKNDLPDMLYRVLNLYTVPETEKQRPAPPARQD
ncbi:MAG: hypothetical protein ACOX5Z_02410 [Desulfobulbus sp.]|jgi:hypothetical protein